MLKVGDTVRLECNPIGVSINERDFKGKVGTITKIAKGKTGQPIYCVLDFWFIEEELEFIDESMVIAMNFKKFLHSQRTNTYEVAMWCAKLLKHNGIEYTIDSAKFDGDIKDYDLQLNSEVG